MYLSSPVIQSIGDVCMVIADNQNLHGGVFRARAARLAKKIEAALDAKAPSLELTDEEIVLACEMAGAIVDQIVKGFKPVVGSMVVMRICERVVTPITDAMGYPGP